MHVHVLYFIVYLKGVILRVRKTYQINLPIPNKKQSWKRCENKMADKLRKKIKVTPVDQ